MMKILSRGVVGCMIGLAGVSLSEPRPVRGQGTAPPPTPATTNPTQVDLASSRVYMKVKSSGRMGHEHGIIGKLESGSIDWSGKGELVFSTKSFIADAPEARQYVGLAGSVSASDRKKTLDNMLGKDVLDVARYPTATYKITTTSALDGQTPGTAGRYKLEGTFTLHGVAKPLTILSKLEETKTAGVLRMTGSFALVQTQYGITPYSALGGLVGVADQMDVWGDFLLKPAAAATAAKPAARSGATR